MLNQYIQTNFNGLFDVCYPSDLLKVVSTLRVVLVNKPEHMVLVHLPGDGLQVVGLAQLVPPLCLRVLHDLLLLHPHDPPPQLLLVDAAVPVQVDLVADEPEPPLTLLRCEVVKILSLVISQERLMIILIVTLIMWLI